MKPDRYHRAADLFQEVMKLLPERRHEHIDQAADGDNELASRIHRMVRYAESAEPTTEQFLLNNESSSHDDEAGTALIGAMIGRYRIVRRIGEGGFGTVYQAEQETPVRRTVALKILKSGMDSLQVVARFEAERQALALMEHPGIARVIDAGRTKALLGSRPYFVMEFVTGEPVTDYCNRCSLSFDARLELFQTVCHAVQHAHQKGVIHRDLKPSNILVTEIDGEAMPKIIDFGIAKAIYQPLTDVMLVTNRAELLGTPQYMSPEQVDADDRAIDTRTDVYSLGVVLYELLTGTAPLDEQLLQHATYSRVLRIILEQRIERPSTRVARLGDVALETARRQKSDVKSMIRRLRGEVDWILLKSLETDRDRRYSSPAALAEDLHRYLNHQPVAAGPPGAAYRIRKFIRRHRVGVAATGIVALVVIAGAVGTTLAMVRARDAADQTVQVNQFMREILTSVDPERGQGADVRLVEILKNAADTASQRFAGHPELEAQIHELLGQVYDKLSLFLESVSEHKRALALTESAFGPDDPRSLRIRVSYVRALGNEGRLSDKEGALDGLADRIERVFGRNDDLWFSVQQMHGIQLTTRRQFAEAEALLQQLGQQAEAAGADQMTQLRIMRALVRTLWKHLDNTYGAARRQLALKLEPVARELSDRSARYLGPTAISALEDRMSLAQASCELGHYAAASDMCSSVLDATKERYGECHDIRVAAMDVLCKALLREDKADQAAELVLRLINCRRSQMPVVYVAAVFDAIPILDRGGRWTEGEQLARELRERLAAMGGGHGPMLLDAELSVAHFVSLQGRRDEADQMFQALMAREEEAKQNATVLARMHLFYGAHVAKQGQFELAQQHLQAAADALDDIRQGTWNTVPDDVIIEFIALYRAWGKPDKVAEYEHLREEALHPEMQSQPADE